MLLFAPQKIQHVQSKGAISNGILSYNHDFSENIR